jgi:hypothetical protein
MNLITPKLGKQELLFNKPIDIEGAKSLDVYEQTGL